MFTKPCFILSADSMEKKYGAGISPDRIIEAQERAESSDQRAASGPMAKAWGMRNPKWDSNKLFWRAAASSRIYRAPFWTPSSEDIVELEEFLWSYLVGISAELDGRTPDCYWRQYAGVTGDAGNKEIYVLGFSSKFSASDEQLQEDFVDVCDGGAAIWRVVFDTAGKSFSKFCTNGYA